MATISSALIQTPRTFAQLLAETPEDEFEAGDPSPRAILEEVRERESACMRFALELVLDRDATTIPAPDSALGRRPGSDAVPKARLLADIALQRQATVTRLEGIGPEDWSRTASLPDGSLTTIAQLAERWLDIDAATIARLERALGRTVAEVLSARFGDRD